MPNDKTPQTVLATIGAVFWAIQGIPQVYKSYRTKSTKGLSPYLVLIWSASSLFFCTYVNARDLALPAIVQPHISVVFYIIAWAQCLYYNSQFSLAKSVLWCLCLLGGGAAFEGCSIIGLRAGIRNGTQIPTVVYGYTSVVLSVLGLVPQYYEIYKQREVVGLSITFVVADLVGAVFLIAALFLRPTLDISGFVTYALTAIMVSGIVILAVILNPLAAKKRKLNSLPSTTADLAASAPPPSAHGVGKGQEKEDDHKLYTSDDSEGEGDASDQSTEHQRVDGVVHQFEDENHHIPVLGYSDASQQV